jgi:hypothetical protein
MANRKTILSLQTLFILLTLFVIALIAIDFSSRGTYRRAFVSSELQFTDPSMSGLGIMPASCSSNPSYFHSALPATADGMGYSLAPGYSEYGVYRNGVYVCVTSNTSGNTYFIPANTAQEMINFVDSSPPGVTDYR